MYFNRKNMKMLQDGSFLKIILNTMTKINFQPDLLTHFELLKTKVIT